MLEKRYSIGEVSELSGISTQTLRRWDDTGRVKADFRLPGGKRFYNESTMMKIMELNVDQSKPRKVIGYCRVSTKKQKDDLERQVDNVKTYLLTKGKPFEIISDIGSGINYKNRGLNKLINMIINGEVETVVVLYKDRLVRFGYELIEDIASRFSTDIEIIDTSEHSFEEELSLDLIQIITVFSSKINGRRSSKTKKLLEEVVKNESSKNP